MNIQKELSTLSDTIEENKRELAQNEGREQELLKSLKSLLSVKTFEEAEEELAQLKIKERNLENQMIKDITKLKEEYGW